MKNTEVLKGRFKKVEIFLHTQGGGERMGLDHSGKVQSNEQLKP